MHRPRIRRDHGITKQDGRHIGRQGFHMVGDIQDVDPMSPKIHFSLIAQTPVLGHHETYVRECIDQKKQSIRW